MEKKGFTITELLMALAVLAVIFTSAFTVFRSASTAWLKGEARNQRYQQARAILERVSSEVASSLVTRSGSIYFEGDLDKLFFVCPLPDTQISDLCEVGYYLSDGCLMRHYEEDPDFVLLESDEDEGLGSNVTELKFEYHYLTGSIPLQTDDWDSRLDRYPEDSRPDGLPRAVGIRITVSDEARRESEDFETTVYLQTH